MLTKTAWEDPTSADGRLAYPCVVSCRNRREIPATRLQIWFDVCENERRASFVKFLRHRRSEGHHCRYCTRCIIHKLPRFPFHFIVSLQVLDAPSAAPVLTNPFLLNRAGEFQIGPENLQHFTTRSNQEIHVHSIHGLVSRLSWQRSSFFEHVQLAPLKPFEKHSLLPRRLQAHTAGAAIQHGSKRCYDRHTTRTSADERRRAPQPDQHSCIAARCYTSFNREAKLFSRASREA